MGRKLQNTARVIGLTGSHTTPQLGFLLWWNYLVFCDYRFVGATLSYGAILLGDKGLHPKRECRQYTETIRVLSKSLLMITQLFLATYVFHSNEFIEFVLWIILHLKSSNAQCYGETSTGSYRNTGYIGKSYEDTR